MNQDDKTYSTDRIETATSASSNDEESTFPVDSPTSASDAGLDDELLEETGSDFDMLEDDLNAADSEFEGASAQDFEIPISDIESDPDYLTSPEMTDSNVPGEIDIEELDEHALDNTDLPADARLDPLED